MKRKLLSLILLVYTCLMLTGCQEKIVAQPDIEQIRSICNLATLECYYHNVAKAEKEGSWLKKDRKLWIEYTGTAKIGIDMSKVGMVVEGTQVTVTLPNAELLEIGIYKEDLNEDSYILSSDGLISNKITAEDQSEAINVAQNKMSETVSNNKTLLVNARDRAKKMIENHINKLGELSGNVYEIKWVYSEDTPTGTENTEDVVESSEE